LETDPVLSGPAIGEPDPERAAPGRIGFAGAASGILVLLAVGLILRLIIAYLLPGSGFGVDIGAFSYWANNLADHGLYGFYERDFFHDYTPGYLYVLWLVGSVGNLVGGIGDLIKIPPILGDLALAYLTWSMVRELGGSERSARIGALIVILNPVTWFDSVVWGQVDAVGVVVLLLALRELWRDRPERAAILAALAALIKPQLGILIPIVAIVVIRRALWPSGGYGTEGPPEPGATTTGWGATTTGRGATAPKMPVPERIWLNTAKAPRPRAASVAEPASATPGISRSATAISAATLFIASPPGRSPGHVLAA